MAKLRASLRRVLPQRREHRARLESALVDPAATAERRIAAALALSATDEGRTRVRIAADAGAEPAERAALVAIADGRDAEAEVEAALRRAAGEAQ